MLALIWGTKLLYLQELVQGLYEQSIFLDSFLDVCSESHFGSAVLSLSSSNHSPSTVSSVQSLVFKYQWCPSFRPTASRSPPHLHQWREGSHQSRDTGGSFPQTGGSWRMDCFLSGSNRQSLLSAHNQFNLLQILWLIVHRGVSLQGPGMAAIAQSEYLETFSCCPTRLCEF